MELKSSKGENFGGPVSKNSKKTPWSFAQKLQGFVLIYMPHNTLCNSVCLYTYMCLLTFGSPGKFSITTSFSVISTSTTIFSNRRG